MSAGLTRREVLDLYYLDARCKLIDIAAFLDRVERAEGETDFRWDGFREAMKRLASGQTGRAEQVLVALSDPTVEPIAKAPTKGASGAWPGPVGA